MTRNTYEQLHDWLENGTDLQKKHATLRLALPDALEYPPFVKQVKTAIQAAGSVVSSIVRGEPVSVPDEEQDRRLEICHGCEFWDVNKERCSKCGCFGQWKTWLASQRCPIGKW